MRLLSPVYSKETTQLANGRAFLLAKLVTLVLLLLTTGLFFYYNRAEAAEDPSALGGAYFFTLAFVEMLVLAVVTPLLTASCVCGEREARTLGLLLLTRLSPWQMVQDKGLSRLTALATLILVSLPFFFAALLIGGVEPWQVVNVLGNLLAVTVLAGGLGLWASTNERRVTTAVLQTYLSLGLWLIFLPAIVSALVVGVQVPEVAPWLSPLTSVGMSAVPDAVRNFSSLPWSWLGTLLISTLVYLHHVRVSATYLQRWRGTEEQMPPWLTQPPGTVAPPAADQRRARQATAASYDDAPPPAAVTAAAHATLMAANLAALRRRAWQRVRGLANPITARENSRQHYDYHTRFAFYGALIVPALLMVLAALSRDRSDWPEVLIGMGQAAYAMIAPVVLLQLLFKAATAIVRERQQDTLALLLTTRVSGAQLIWGHTRALLRYALLLLTPAFAWLTAAAIVDALHYHHRLGPALTLAVLRPALVSAYALLVIALGLRLSLHARSVLGAVIMTGAALLLIEAVGTAALIKGWGGGLVVAPYFWGYHVSSMFSLDGPAEGPVWRLFAPLLLHAVAAATLFWHLARHTDASLGRQPA